MDKQKIAENVLRTHKKAKGVWITTDMMPFLSEQQAVGHQKSLSKPFDKASITYFSRPAAEPQKEKKAKKTTKENKNNKKTVQK